MKEIEGKKIKVVQILLITFSLAFIAFGLLNGEAKTVFTKAIYICLECIGIG